MLSENEKTQCQEKLVKLFLRLNGFFSEGFIVHAPLLNQGGNYTEVDVIGVRPPFSSEPEREITYCDSLLLDISKTNIIIGEVKTSGRRNRAKFNDSLSQNNNAIKSVIKKIGYIEDASITELIINEVKKLFTLNNNQYQPRDWRKYDLNGDVALSSVIFLPAISDNDTNDCEFYSINGTKIFDFIWRCLRPMELREGCNVRYPFGNWGEYEEIVLYFKDLERDEPGNIETLYSFVYNHRVKKFREQRNELRRERLRNREAVMG